MVEARQIRECLLGRGSPLRLGLDERKPRWPEMRMVKQHPSIMVMTFMANQEDTSSTLVLFADSVSNVLDYWQFEVDVRYEITSSTRSHTTG